MPARLDKDEFIRRASLVHSNKYNYSKVEYKNLNTNVCIICPKHGEFWQLPSNHLHGANCPACSGRERITKDVFIKRATKVHRGRYDYSKIVYKNSNEPVEIICPKHGSFFQKPKYHLKGNGCQKCFATPKSTTEEFIEKAKKIYGNEYDYSKVVYEGNKKKVTIICPEHGAWDVTPNNFLRGSRCPGCYGTPKHTTEEFIKNARKVHGRKYDYSKVKYDGLKKEVIIICPIHGEFKQFASSHLNGCGCRKCSGTEKITKKIFLEKSKANHTIQYDYSKVEFKNPREKVCIICPKHGIFWQNTGYHMHGGNCPKCVGGTRLTTEEFIKKAKEVHDDKYDYSKVKYKNTATKVCIICPEHGEFYQTPNNHLFGSGCPTCPQSNMEGEVRQLLLKNNIAFEQEKGFPWLKYKKKLFLDFYLPTYNLGIECQGGQHFFPVDIFGGEKFFIETQERDALKRELCEKHGIKILYYSNASIDYPYDVIEGYNNLLEIIKGYGQKRNSTDSNREGSAG